MVYSMLTIDYEVNKLSELESMKKNLFCCKIEYSGTHKFTSPGPA